MVRTLELSEGMRIGLPFRAQSTVAIDRERFDDYDYEFPDHSSITLIETADHLADLTGYYGTAIAEVSTLEETEAGYYFVTLTLTRVDVDGKLSLTREERSGRRDYHDPVDSRERDSHRPDGESQRVNRRY
jgi:hypothetical protein